MYSSAVAEKIMNGEIKSARHKLSVISCLRAILTLSSRLSKVENGAKLLCVDWCYMSIDGPQSVTTLGFSLFLSAYIVASIAKTDVETTTTTTITTFVDENFVLVWLGADSDRKRVLAGGVEGWNVWVGAADGCDVGCDDGDVGLEVGCDDGDVGLDVGCEVGWEGRCVGCIVGCPVGSTMSRDNGNGETIFSIKQQNAIWRKMKRSGGRLRDVGWVVGRQWVTEVDWVGSFGEL